MASYKQSIKYTVFLFLMLPACLPAAGQDARTQWVDSVMARMNTRDRIASLFLLAVNTDQPDDQLEEITRQIKSRTPGGVYITGGSPKGHIRWIQQLRQESDVPLLVAASLGKGLHRLFDSVPRGVPALVRSAAAHDSLSFAWGAELAQQLQAMSVQMAFSPILTRSEARYPYDTLLLTAGSSSSRISRQTSAFVQGMQSRGLLCVAGFLPPRQAAAPVTSEEGVWSIAQLDTSVLTPLRTLLAASLRGVVTAHVAYPLKGRPEFMPPAAAALFTNTFLKSNLAYEGLTIAYMPALQDALGDLRPGEREARAFEMGHDLLVAPEDLDLAIRRINQLLNRQRRLREQLNQSVRKILEAKYDAGLWRNEFFEESSGIQRLYAPQARLLNEMLYEKSVTLLQNTDTLLPVRSLETWPFRYVQVGAGPDGIGPWLRKYVPLATTHIESPADTLALVQSLTAGEWLIVGVLPSAEEWEGALAQTWSRVAARHKVIVVHMGNPYQLRHYTTGVQAVLATYTPEGGRAAAQVVFGALPARGVLPIEVTPRWREGISLTTTPLQRLGYSLPEAVGMNSRVLDSIKLVAWEAIQNRATPGCHILIARKGKVVWEQSMGWYTYQNQQPVHAETIYDLASITKVAATLQAIMFLHERGQLDLYKKVSAYLPELRQSNKGHFTIKDILTHQAGLWPFLPFWAQTVKDGKHLPEYYATLASADYPHPVSENLYGTKAIKDSLWQWVVKSRIREKTPRVPPDYRYSDMGFYILHRIIEKAVNQPLDEFLEQNFYEPLGAHSTGYLPRRRFPAAQIAPTEDDRQFRLSLLVGFVHDQGAAMHGGVAGHAGLFSNANDLAKLGQMWLQKGFYGGHRYFQPGTLDYFTQKQYAKSRRGLGWDRPAPDDKNNPTARQASELTFGHTGFTGTCIWVDPAAELVYIFLSNRVHPDMNNTRLLTGNIRIRIQELAYRAITDR